MSNNISKESLFVKARSPEQIIFEGQAESISSINDKGKFDILPYHANLISIVKDYLIIREKLGKEKELKITNGVVFLENNRVNIFVGMENL